MSFIHANEPWCTIRYLGQEYGLLDGFYYSDAIAQEMSEVMQKNPSKYLYRSRVTLMIRPAWRIDAERRLWLEEIQVAASDPSLSVIQLPHHPYPVLGTWVESMRLLVSETIISPNTTGKVTVRLEVLTLWFEEGKVIRTQRTTETMGTYKLRNYIEE